MQEHTISTSQKSVLQLLGLLMFLGGLLAAGSAACALLITLSDRNSGDFATRLILVLWTLTALSLGGGFVFFTHSSRSLRRQPSGKLRLPSLARLGGLFVVLLLAGLFVSLLRFATAWFLPLILLAAATLPPLIAVGWFMRARPGRLTWRRGSVAFVLGATVAVTLAIILEFILPGMVVLVVSRLATAFGRYVQAFLDALGGGQVGAALTSRGFILLFVQLALIAPIVEELCKPLAILPVLRYLGKRDAFMVGALAGAGFAAVENIIYLVSGFSAWPGLLLVRALGAAIHPFGAGLVASGWSEVLQHKPGARITWLVRFSAAAGMHAVWNGGLLLIITLAGVPFFGRTPQLDVLGVPATGVALAFLIVVGLTALWAGRDVANHVLVLAVHAEPASSAATLWSFDFTVSDRAIALWAIACLAVVVPVGIVALNLMNR
jgi:RsiW-degrading membrane proteinase PrsW (M82 family)